MPQLDGTGPRGAGPRTGRRQGICEPSSGIRCGLGWGFGLADDAKCLTESIVSQRNATASLKETALRLLKRVGR